MGVLKLGAAFIFRIILVGVSPIGQLSIPLSTYSVFFSSGQLLLIDVGMKSH